MYLFINNTLLSARFIYPKCLGCSFEGTSKLSVPQTEFMIRLGSEEESRPSQTYFPTQYPILVNDILLEKPKKLGFNLEMRLSSLPYPVIH